MNPKSKILLPYEIGLPLFFFLLYFFWGYNITCLSESASTMDVFFFSDTARVFGDLTDTVRVNSLMTTEINHYRSLVHPVFMLFFYPIVQYLNLFFGNYLISIVLLQSLLGALNCFILMQILKKMDTGVLWQILLSLLYGFSFTQFVFTMQPETFLYAATGLLLFWYFVITRIKDEKPLAQTDYVLLVFYGVFCLGITVTNYMQFVVGLSYLLLEKEKKLIKALKQMIPILCISFAFTVVINNIQIGLWRNSGNFLVYITDFLINPYNDEKTYISMGFGITHLINILKSFFMHNFAAPAIYFTEAFELGAYSLTAKLVLILLWIILLPAPFLSFMGERQKQLSLAAVLICTLILNGLLHIFYGNDELFLYTQHFTFLIILLLGLWLKPAAGKVKGLCFCALTIFILFEVLCNFKALQFIARIVQANYPSGDMTVASLNPPLIVLIKALIISMFFAVLFIPARKVFHKTNLGGKSVLCVVLCTLIIFVPTGLKLGRDRKIINTITANGKIIEAGGDYQVYHNKNQLLYVFENTETAYMDKQGHGFSVTLTQGQVYAREDIDFNKSYGYKLYSFDKKNTYYLIEIHSADFSGIEIKPPEN